MSNSPRSSEDGVPDAPGLAVLAALAQRNSLGSEDLVRLIPEVTDITETLQALLQREFIRGSANEYQLAYEGKQHLDAVLAGIQSQLSPDDPAYVERFRQETPSLPFAANTIWEQAICVNVRMLPEALRPLIPGQFELDLYDGHAFVSLTASRLKNFGVGKLPAAARMNFYQATYRAHVTFTDFRGRRIRGCYFVRSETNSHIMSLTANLLPEFKAHHCSTYPILMAKQGSHLVLSVDSADDAAGKVVLVIDTSHPLPEMPAGSVFRSVDEAYDYIVEFHDAFSYNPDTGDVFILRIDRGPWHIKIHEPLDHYLGFFEEGPFPAGSCQLDSVFYFTQTPYRWLPLLTEKINTV